MRRRANPAPRRTIALVGLMGVGKSSVGRRLANRLKLPFAGEAEFRAGEARVIRRLLEGPPIVLATGGGAMMNADTRVLLKQHADTVWLRAELAVIAERVARRDTRPLLRDRDPMEVLTGLAEARYPIYAEADLTVDVGAGSHGQAVDAIHRELRRHWKQKRRAETST